MTFWLLQEMLQHEINGREQQILFKGTIWVINKSYRFNIKTNERIFKNNILHKKTYMGFCESWNCRINSFYFRDVKCLQHSNNTDIEIESMKPIRENIITVIDN